ncbi:methyltransferase-like protein 27 isoform X2 [Acanthaster planci]|uniref:Methyltransferase-like protein 27 isoform X2 n=1 Tax=Acanthaster planci TaxID=133434 RepID=A0A8B7XXC6_ACAPL|nr:methyltransferase-like protein 27 isoform X2 [Acanthaster planci]
MDSSENLNSEAARHMHAIHQIARGGGDFHDSIQAFYQKWAGSYDKDMDPTHYGGPAFGADALNKALKDKNAHIVDCAAGTGKVGEELAKRGFTRIDAVDFSPKCLEISASKGVYERLICDKLGSNRLKGIDDGYYSALICVGAISVGHLTHDVFPEFNRIVKKGGFIVFTRSKLVFPDGNENHTGALDEIQNAIDILIKEGVWELVDIVSIDESFCVGYGCDVYTIRRL